ncbi:aldose 1-epimerase [Rhizobium sp. YIM 134829]|uniref:aldose 1-epimerase n=1 Tax=Rhizobium sp. YIM 134829 TaxID=3390453 RepID=UPI00397B65FC
MDEDRIRLQKGGLTLEVSPVGGAILSASFEGRSILQTVPSPGLATQVFGGEACFPLVPFGNRIEGNGFQIDGRDYHLAPNTADPLVLHGDGWLRHWALAERSEHSITLTLHHPADAGSPYHYSAEQVIALTHDALVVRLSVTHHGQQPLPYGLGFHPNFPRTPATRLTAEAETYWTERAQHLPNQPLPLPADLRIDQGTRLPARWLNNALDGWGGTARIDWPEIGLGVTLTTEPLCRHLVVYAPSPEQPFVSIEPMTHRPNAHHAGAEAGLVLLATGESLHAAMTLRVERSG